MTMNGSWGWRDDNKWKSSETLIRNLIDIASKGGNYLLNVGPKPDGTFPDESIQRLKEIGRWMDVNGQAIYGTKAGPFAPLSWGRCTQKEEMGNTLLYLFVFDWPEDGKLDIPEFNSNAVSARLVATNGKLETSESDEGLLIHLPLKAPDKIASVVRLEIRGKISE